MTDKEKIRAEIERLRDIFRASTASIDSSKANVLTDLLSFIDSLQEENNITSIKSKHSTGKLKELLNAKTPAESLGISQEEHDRIVDECIYGKEPEMVDIDDLPKENPVSDDLEEEIKRYVYDPYFDLNGVAVKGATSYLTVEDVADIAIHFAEWGKKHSEMEIRSQSMALVHGCLKELSEDLEKAADNYSDGIESMYQNEMFDRGDIMGAFEAGANWQKQIDLNDTLDSDAFLLPT